MLEDGFFAHESRDGSSFAARVKRYYRPRGTASWSAGENLLYSTGEIDAATAIAGVARFSPPTGGTCSIRAGARSGSPPFIATSAGGTFGGEPTWVMTMDFGARTGGTKTVSKPKPGTRNARDDVDYARARGAQDAAKARTAPGRILVTPRPPPERSTESRVLLPRGTEPPAEAGATCRTSQRAGGLAPNSTAEDVGRRHIFPSGGEKVQGAVSTGSRVGALAGPEGAGRRHPAPAQGALRGHRRRGGGRGADQRARPRDRGADRAARRRRSRSSSGARSRRHGSAARSRRCSVTARPSSTSGMRSSQRSPSSSARARRRCASWSATSPFASRSSEPSSCGAPPSSGARRLRHERESRARARRRGAAGARSRAMPGPDARSEPVNRRARAIPSRPSPTRRATSSTSPTAATGSSSARARACRRRRRRARRTSVRRHTRRTLAASGRPARLRLPGARPPLAEP